ncbi:MAG: Rieske 2Fe-2S domain-containing protein [Sphingomonadales bacterium]|nr:Rieske 2Fe-2S domain-containing protein [Sphingomonadales bacterium]
MIERTAMSRSQLYEMTRSLIAHGKAKTMELADRVVSIPASAYTDPEQFEIEKAKIFKRMPLMLAPSCELSKPGDFKAMTVVGVPVLLTRQKDGSVAAFLNMCTHRGNPVAQGQAMPPVLSADITAGCSKMMGTCLASHHPAISARSTRRSIASPNSQFLSAQA